MPGCSIDYFVESEKYKPNVVKILLIGEAPPPSGRSYFYVPRPMSSSIPIEKDRSLPATIFYHYFQKRPETEEGYVDLLNRLKDMGIFLMDIVDQPLVIRERKGLNEGNLNFLIGEIPKLRRKIKNRGVIVDDKNIIFLLPRPYYAKELRKEFPQSRFITWKGFRMAGGN